MRFRRKLWCLHPIKAIMATNKITAISIPVSDEFTDACICGWKFICTIDIGLEIAELE